MLMQKITKFRGLLAEGQMEAFFDMIACAESPRRHLIASEDGDSAVSETHEDNFYSNLVASHGKSMPAEPFAPTRASANSLSTERKPTWT